MKLWNYIYDFLINHIFVSGGENSNIMLDVGNGQQLELYKWLATTSTIIVLVLMVVFLFLVVRWCFRLTSGLLQGK